MASHHVSKELPKDTDAVLDGFGNFRGELSRGNQANSGRSMSSDCRAGGFGCRLCLFPLGFRLRHALGRDAMGEISARVFMDVSLNLSPISRIIADAFALGADGQQCPQRFDLIERIPPEGGNGREA